MLTFISAGHSGPKCPVLADPSAPQHEDAATLGLAMFEGESMEDWASLLTMNVTSHFFMSTAFLGLLAKGSEDVPGFWSNIINITSVCGITKMNQCHASLASDL